jgi:caudovirus prohead protease|nr:MAG TPA: major capsid protein [Caudoviricetes sp.]
MTIKQKIVSVTGKLSTKSVDGERRIVFVASSNNEDRHYEHVDVASLRLPLKGGGDITVSAIPSEGVSEVIDIPLMLNHSGDVRDVIGSIRAAYFSNNELTFEAGISKREIAQEMLTLLEEGHLSNAFSITMIDYDYNIDSETISKAEVIEVSLVYRGSNKEARLLAIKSLLGDGMKTKQNDNFGDANGDGKDHTVAPEAPEVETSETTEAPETAGETSADNSDEEATNESEGETQEAPETNNNEEKEETMNNKEIAKDAVVEKGVMPNQPASANNYLKTKAALLDFKKIVLKNHRGSNEQIMREWSENLKSKGVTGDAIMPSQIENIFFKAWVDNPGILATFRTVDVKSAAVYAIGTSDTANGHKKGDAKVDQSLTNIRRDLKGLGIYKKLPIDLQDLYDDEKGELLTFRVEELAARVANAIAVGALIGQGAGDKATLQGTRGLYPMLADINATNGYGSNVATKVTGETGEGSYELAVRAVGAVKDEKNAGKILVVPTGFTTELKLAKGSDGHLMFPAGSNLANLLDVKQIFEIDELVGKDVKAIAYANQSYVLIGEPTATVRTDFDTNKNQDVMLTERYVGGSAQGYKTVAGVFAHA